MAPSKPAPEFISTPDPGQFPRRNRVDLHTPAEAAIRNAMIAVEEAGAHPLLTDAVDLLEQAKGKVADFVELQPDRQNAGPLTTHPARPGNGPGASEGDSARARAEPG